MSDENEYNPPIVDAYYMLQVYMSCIGDEGDEKIFNVTVGLVKEAFASGLPVEDEIAGFAIYGNALVFRALALREHKEILDKGVTCSDQLMEGLNAIETALKKDAEHNTNYFKDESNREVLLDDRIGEIWRLNSLYLKQELGNEAAIKYLSGKIDLLRHLNTSYFPCMSLYLAIYLIEEAKHPEIAVQWLNYAVQAECTSDSKISISCKERAQQALRELED